MSKFTHAGVGGVSKSVSMDEVNGNGVLGRVGQGWAGSLFWLITSTTSGGDGGYSGCFVNSIYLLNVKQGQVFFLHILE